MAKGKVRFGLVIQSLYRSFLSGSIGRQDISQLARLADREPAWDSLWVTDSIVSQGRIDAFVMLAALATVTQRLKLGVGCLMSMPLRNALQIAYQWISLDYLSNGRTIFVACQGEGSSPGGQLEFSTFHIDPATRMRRMEEAIEVLRLTSMREDVSYEGDYNSFTHITILPRPVQQPVPIWVTANPDPKKPRSAESAFRRVARLGDGWMSVKVAPEAFARDLTTIRQYAREEGRDLGPGFEASIFYDINVSEDRDYALQESQRFLEEQYGTNYTIDAVNRRTALGSPRECVEQISRFVDAGATTIVLRLASWDPIRQFRRVTDDVLPALV